MSQKRILDYGANVLSSHINDSNKIKYSSGLFYTTQAPIEIAGNTSVKVNPYAVITPNGIIVTETTSQDLAFSLTLETKNYTILLRHTAVQATGGSAAYIEVLDNLYDLDAFTDGTVIGWVIYPGGNVVLDSTMLYYPRSLKLKEPSKDIPSFQMTAPFTKKWYELNTDPEIQYTEMFSGGRVFTRVSNSNTIIVRNATLLIPVVASEYQPSIIRITCRADFQAAVSVSVLDENGIQYIPANPIISNTAWGIFEVKLANYNGLSLFKNHYTWSIRLVVQVNPGKTFDLQSVEVSDYSVPKQGGIFADVNYTFTFTRIASCLNFWNAFGGLPTLPTAGDRYIASSTGNGWTKNNIYEWSGSSWTETVPVEGNVCQITLVMPIEDYVYAGVDSGFVNSVPTHLILV